MIESFEMILERQNSDNLYQIKFPPFEMDGVYFEMNRQRAEDEYKSVASNSLEENEKVIQTPVVDTIPIQNDAELSSNQQSILEMKDINDESECDQLLKDFPINDLCHGTIDNLNTNDDAMKFDKNIIQTFFQQTLNRETQDTPLKTKDADPQCLKNKVNKKKVSKEKEEESISQPTTHAQESIKEETHKVPKRDYGKNVALVILLLKIWIEFRNNKKENNRKKLKKFTAQEASTELGFQNKTMEYYRLQLNKAVALGTKIDITLYLNKTFGELNSEVERIMESMSENESKDLKAKCKEPKNKKALLKLLYDYA